MTCLYVIFVLLLNIAIGSVCAGYVFDHVFHITLGFWLAGLIGLIGGEITIPAALITFVLVLVGILH